MLDRVREAGVEVGGTQLVGLYLFLRHHEEELDATTLKVLNSLERELFHHLSIDEMERLEEAYRESQGGA